MRGLIYSYFIVLVYILLADAYSWPASRVDCQKIRFKNLTLLSSSSEQSPAEKARRQVNQVLPDRMKIKRGKFTISELIKGLIRDMKHDFLPWIDNTFREFLRSPKIIKAIIGINVAVWIGWKYLPEEFMKLYFVRRYQPLDVGLTNWLQMTLFDPLWYTRITASFSHPSLLMLIPNMFLLASIGKKLSMQLGHMTFIVVTLTSAYFSILLDEVLHYLLHLLSLSTKKILSRSHIPPNPVEVLGFAGVISSLLVVHASSRVPTEDLSEEDIDKMQKDVRQQFMKNIIFLMLQKLLKIPLLAGFGIQIGGLLWGFYCAQWLTNSNKLY